MRRIGRATVLTVGENWRSTENLLRLGILLAVLVIVGVAFLLRHKLSLTGAGYGGVALTALLGSGGLVVPVPALATACTASAFLNPLYVGLIAGTGETVGELTGYFLGYSGRGVINRNRLYLRMEGWMRSRGWTILFLVSMVPNPVFDIIGVAAGALRYPLWGFLGVVGAGKLVKFVTFAYACAYSIEWLTRVFKW